MKRLSIFILILVAIALLVESKLARKPSAKPLKLTGIAISTPQPRDRDQGSERTLASTEQRRATKLVSPVVTTQQIPSSIKLTPQQEYIRNERIARARLQWERVRMAALEKLDLDEHTREMYDSLRDIYYNGNNEEDKLHYEENIERLLGPERFKFLTDAREEFKARVFNKTNIEIGPLMGAL